MAMTITIIPTDHTYYWNSTVDESTDRDGVDISSPFQVASDYRTHVATSVTRDVSIKIDDCNVYPTIDYRNFVNNTATSNNDTPSVYAPMATLQDVRFQQQGPSGRHFQYCMAEFGWLVSQIRFESYNRVKVRHSMSLTYIGGTEFTTAAPRSFIEFTQATGTNQASSFEANHFNGSYVFNTSNRVVRHAARILSFENTETSGLITPNFENSIGSLNTSTGLSTVRYFIHGNYGNRYYPCPRCNFKLVDTTLPTKVQNCDGANNMRGFRVPQSSMITCEVNNRYNISGAITVRLRRGSETYTIPLSNLVTTYIGQSRVILTFSFSRANILSFASQNGSIFVDVVWTAFYFNGYKNVSFNSLITVIPVIS